MTDVNSCSGRTLAFLGDAVWSTVVRYALIQDGEGKGKRLQKRSISYVSAKSQAYFYAELDKIHFFTEEEQEIYHRGRNADSGAVPHHTDVQTYRMSTGFEAVIGALYMEKNEKRIWEIFEKVRTLRSE